MKPAPPDPPEITAQLWFGIRGHTGWDIGANCGQTLHQLAARFSTVHAFEPAVECHPWLDSAAKAHPGGIGDGGGITIHHLAISDHDGLIDLLAAPGKIDTGQLVTDGPGALDWNPADSTPRTVEAATCDSLAVTLGPPDFCKVDVEGHEAHVLAGAGTLLDTHHPDWLIEFHSPTLHGTCQRRLQAAGYTVRTIRHPHYSPGSTNWFTHGWIRATHPEGPQPIEPP